MSYAVTTQTQAGIVEVDGAWSASSASAWARVEGRQLGVGGWIYVWRQRGEERDLYRSYVVSDDGIVRRVEPPEVPRAQ